jgi:hypothetical protein
MTEVEFRFPGLIAYSYVSVKGTPEELMKIDPAALGMLFQQALHSFSTAERDAVDLIKGGSGPVEIPTEKPVEDPEDIPPTDASRAASTLSEGLGGATEIGNVNEPPWEKPKNSKAGKPWDKSNTKPARIKTAADDDDFF